MPTRVLIEGGWVFAGEGDGPFEILPGAVVAVEGERISYVGPASGLPEGWAPTRRIDARDKAVLPGFVNAHTHHAMTLLRGYADDVPLMPWLQEHIWPAEENLTGDDVYWGTLLAIAESLQAGVTAFADMYFFMDRVAQAALETGVRAHLSRGLIGVAPGSDRALEEGRELVATFQGAGEGRIRCALAPHAPYTCPPEYMRKVLAAAEQLGCPIHTHLAETKAEVEQIRAQYGKSPIRHFADLGVFEHETLAAHCVHLEAADIELLARHGVRVAHNPISNCKLASGIAPVTELLEAGVTVGLASDGAASTNHLDMFEEMRLAANLQKVSRMDARALPAWQVLRMATVGGARALGFDRLGCLAPGYLADIVILDLNAPHLWPRHDLTSLVVYSAKAGDVDTVLVHGRVVMDGGELLTIDIERVEHEAQARAERLARAARRGSR
ncbi:MAG TPA: amidohydrolase [Thermaerobacter sp.]